jgi:hypothetical protein
MTAVVVVMTLRGLIRAWTILLRLRLGVRLKLGEVRALPPFARKKRRMGHPFHRGGERWATGPGSVHSQVPKGIWGTHLLWLFSLLPVPGPPAEMRSLGDRQGNRMIVVQCRRVDSARPYGARKRWPGCCPRVALRSTLGYFPAIPTGRLPRQEHHVRASLSSLRSTLGYFPAIPTGRLPRQPFAAVCLGYNN